MLAWGRRPTGSAGAWAERTRTTPTWTPPLLKPCNERSSQKRIFKPNWTCRDVVAVAVMMPAVGESAAAVVGLEGVGQVLKATGLGVVKFVRLIMLKNSVR